MTGIFRSAIAYLLHHRLKTATLIGALTLTLFAPLAMHLLLGQFERGFIARAEATPLVLGARGSRTDLVIHSLYFAAKPEHPINMSDAAAVSKSELAEAIPLYFAHTARGVPVVGTPQEYHHLRGLNVAEGEGLLILGDCVVGAAAARKLSLSPGDRLVTDLDNVFNIAGAYPLRLLVRGVLEQTNTPDDDVVFVDLKTAWIIAGIGHGHDDLAEPEQEQFITSRTEGSIVAGSAVPHFTDITEENIGDFHFHAETKDLPVTAVIVVPKDEKSGVLLRGRYQSTDSPTQLVVPTSVVSEILDAVFRVGRLFNAVFASVVVTTLLFLILVIVLSLRLRAAERRTMHALGCSRGTVALLFATEYLIILAVSLIFAAILALILSQYSSALIQIIFPGGAS